MFEEIDGDAFYETFEYLNQFAKENYQFKGRIGEFFLNEYLEYVKLPGYYHVISNILLPIGKSKTQLDTVLIHEKGIFCIEFKNLGGWIFGSENQNKWTQSLKKAKKFYLYNPIKQNKTHCEALAKVLKTVPHNIESIVVFSDRCRLMRINSHNVPVIQLQDLSHYLKQFFKENDNRFTEKNVNAVYELLKLYIPSKEQMKEHTERVRKYVEGTECPKCGAELRLKHRDPEENKPIYYFRCINTQCGFERGVNYAEVIKYGNEKDKEWAIRKLL